MSEEVKSKEQKAKDSQLGCMVLVAAFVVLAGFGAIWGSIFGDDSNEANATIHVDISSRTVNSLRIGGPNCDMSGYDLLILDEDGRTVARKNLGKGFSASDYCSFTVKMDIPEMDNFRVLIEVHSGDAKIASRSYQWLSVVQDDGSIELTARWTN